jgi:Plasmid encoded RepA protein
VQLPLPFGPKARLVMMHLNTEAIRSGSPVVEVERSLTAFSRRLLQGNDPNGREIRTIKEQLSTLSVAVIRLAVDSGDATTQVNSQIIATLDLWPDGDPAQRVLWPVTVRLSTDYFESLSRHAVPLDERAVAALAHSATALDVYAWLAQRLHRIPQGRPQFIPWPALHEQFGQGFTRLRAFREHFLDVLRQVVSQYAEARVEVVQREGLYLSCSPPPVLKRLVVLPPTG